MTPRNRAALAIAAAAAAASLGACFSEKPGSTEPVDPLAGCTVPFSDIQAGHTIVAIRNLAFHPDSVRLTRGATVVWVNCEPPDVHRQFGPHTSTSDDGVWNSPLLSPGEHFRRTFDRSDVFPYHCVPHPFMRAQVVVE